MRWMCFSLSFCTSVEICTFINSKKITFEGKKKKIRKYFFQLDAHEYGLNSSFNPMAMCNCVNTNIIMHFIHSIIFNTSRASKSG